MHLDFELWMIHIVWNANKQVEKIEPAEKPLDVEYLFSDNSFSAETFCYARIGEGLDAQLAVKTNLNIEIVEFHKETGEQFKPKCFSPVKDPKTNEVWWIEKGDWKEIKREENGKKVVVKRYYDSPSFHRAGKQTLKIGQSICNVTFAEHGFEPGEFQALLDDFASGLLDIIIADTSTTSIEQTTTEKKKIPNSSFGITEILEDFISNAEKVLQNPNSELRERPELQPAASVRPIPRTFMEMAVKGNPAKLTGRAYYPSYNTPENRYITSIIKRVLDMTNFLLISAKNRFGTFDRQISQLKDKIGFLKKGVVIIDSNKLTNQLKEAKDELLLAEQKLEQIKEDFTDFYSKWMAWCDFLSKHCITENQSDSKISFEFIVTSKPDSYYGFTSFYVKISNPFNIEGKLNSSAESLENNIFSKPNKFKWSLELPNELYYNNILEEDYICSINGTINLKNKLTKEAQKKRRENPKAALDDSDYINILTFSGIKKISLITHPLLTRLQKVKIEANNARNRYNFILNEIEQLQKNNWERKLDKSGLDAARKEQAALEKKLRFLETQKEQQDTAKDGFESNILRLKKLLESFLRLGIEPTGLYPNSMTFIQNPYYRGCHAKFLEILEKAGISEDLLEDISSIQQKGIVDLYDIYERWCLIQIIKVLLDEFHYEPHSPNWRESLVSRLTKGKLQNQSFNCVFTNNEVQRQIELEYHPVWKWTRSSPDEEKPIWANRTPDFELKIKVPNSNLNEGANKWRLATTLVLDAKCKSYDEEHERDTSLEKDLKEIVLTRDYSKGGQNYVFVLHRGRRAAIKYATANQVWSAASYYGGRKYYDWQPEELDHKQGGILLRPFFKSSNSNTGNTQDDLKRLIGMVLEMGVEETASHGNPSSLQKTFCIACGGADIRQEKETIGYQCFNCKRYINKKFCQDCKKSGKKQSLKEVSWKYYYYCQNEGCRHFFVYSYCSNKDCENRRLFKHDSYWTYHDTDVLSPYNVRCPVCGSYGKQPSNDDEFTEDEESTEIKNIIEIDQTEYDKVIAEMQSKRKVNTSNRIGETRTNYTAKTSYDELSEDEAYWKSLMESDKEEYKN